MAVYSQQMKINNKYNYVIYAGVKKSNIYYLLNDRKSNNYNWYFKNNDQLNSVMVKDYSTYSDGTEFKSQGLNATK